MSTVRQFFLTPPECDIATGCVVVHPSDGYVRDGYLECNGSTFSRTTYSKLYGSIGVTYGYTNSYNFRVPDLRGVFLRGWGGYAAALGTYQADEYQSHSHSYKITIGTSTYSGYATAATWSAYKNSWSHELAGNVETRPVNMSVKYLIRYI